MAAVAIVQLIEEKRMERERLDEVIRSLEDAAVKMGEMQPGEVTVKKLKHTRLYMAQMAMRETHRPMKPREICTWIKEKYGYVAKENSIGTMLYRSVHERKDGIFTKVTTKKATYALVDWKKEPVELRESQ